MFSSEAAVRKRTGVNDLSRFEHLQALVLEFQSSADENDKRQVLANLANFAYDPMNYEYLRKLHVLDLFVDMLTEPDPVSVEFGSGGIVNAACGAFWLHTFGRCNSRVGRSCKSSAAGGGRRYPDPIACLQSPHPRIIENVLTALYFLNGRNTRNFVLCSFFLRLSLSDRLLFASRYRCACCVVRMQAACCRHAGVAAQYCRAAAQRRMRSATAATSATAAPATATATITVATATTTNAAVATATAATAAAATTTTTSTSAAPTKIAVPGTCCF